MNMRYVPVDRFRGLKALRRSSSAAPATTVAESQPSLLDGHGEPFGSVRAVRNESERLEQILGATAKKNQNGEYLSLHCWSGDPQQYTPNIQALRLLMPDAPEEVSDPEQWLFLDTETTGLAGGSGTYTFLVGVAWWEGGGLVRRAFHLFPQNPCFGVIIYTCLARLYLRC